MFDASLPDPAEARMRDMFIERMLQSAKGTFDIFGMYLGVRLGFYDALVQNGSLSSVELASKTATTERYAREWMEQQTVAGVIEVEDERAAAKARRYRLPKAHAEVLTDRESLNYLAPLAQLIAGAVRPLQSLLEAYRKGGGVPYADYGIDLVEGQSGINRAMFLKQLGQEWLPAIPDVHARLSSSTPARVADVGCGAGWSAIGIAKCYPNAIVDGFDLDEASIEMAKVNAAAEGISDRVTFEVRDAADPRLAGSYDLVTAFECVHDMSQPVSALRAMRSLAGERGTVLVVDERVGESFTASGNDVEWMMYGWSILHCLAVGMAEEPSAETGTVLRPSILGRYAKQAGFRMVDILPIEHFFFRFYRLVS